MLVLDILMYRRTPQAQQSSRKRESLKYSDTGTRTQVAWVKARYPNQLDYIGGCLQVVCARIFHLRRETSSELTSATTMEHF